MSYNPNIPLNTDPILQSQAQIKANFQTMASAFAANHVPFVTADATLGMHRLMNFNPQTGDPTTSATEIALYTKLVSSIPELFFRPSSSQTPIQMTYPSLKTDGSTTQYSFVAGPFVIYGGHLTNPANGTLVTLAPGANLLYVDLILTSITSTAISAIPTNVNAPPNSFTVSYNSTGGTVSMYYFGIGN